MGGADAAGVLPERIALFRYRRSGRSWQFAVRLLAAGSWRWLSDEIHRGRSLTSPSARVQRLAAIQPAARSTEVTRPLGGPSARDLITLPEPDLAQSVEIVEVLRPQARHQVTHLEPLLR